MCNRLGMTYQHQNCRGFATQMQWEGMNTGIKISGGGMRLEMSGSMGREKAERDMAVHEILESNTISVTNCQR